MKHTLCYLFIMLSIGSIAQTSKSEKMINETITKFMLAGDSNDTESLKSLLNDNFRITMNQLFGSSEVSSVDKSFYLSKIQSKEWGGDQRQITIEDVVIVGKNASAKVTSVGQKSTMVSLLQLVQTASGSWQIVSDLPAMK
ncbi:MAG: hypothetical protein CMP48_11760 [Rickettsiales bacterium]|nr:hypothetical protein [Rickettsiales bacterium]